MKNLKHSVVSAIIVVVLIPLSILTLESCFSAKNTAETKPAPSETPAEYAANVNKPLDFSKAKDSFKIGFYNVENLFDTIDEPLKNDSQYLPNSSIHWTQERYAAKLKNLEKVIVAMGFPSLLGMAEVENARVLTDLLAQPTLAAANYGVAHFDSPDERGIDVALIYKKSDFQVTKATPHKVKFPFEPRDRTRDILEVNGKLKGTDITVFVNHWPSRTGGAEVSEPKRVFVASLVRQKVDSLFQLDPNARIVIIGDLNDNPDNISLTQTLTAAQWQRDTAKSLKNNALYNLAAGVQRRGDGTEYYRGWSVLDQIIVSGMFLNSRSKLVTTDVENVFNPDFITFTDRSGKKLPNRTYTGPIYRGGFSDHFPVYIQVYLK